jgi:hypothetical protein
MTLAAFLVRILVETILQFRTTKIGICLLYWPEKNQMKLLTGSNVSVMKIEFKDRKQNCICSINNWKVDRSLVSIFFVAKARVRRVKNKFLSSTFEKVLCILTSFLLLYVNWTPNIAAMVLHRDQCRCYLGYRKCKEFKVRSF